MKIAGLCSGHDCSYGILENGIPVIHNELERFNRKKEPIDNALRFLFDTYDDYNSINIMYLFDKELTTYDKSL